MFLFWLLMKLFRKRKKKSIPVDAIDTPRLPAPRKGRAEWEVVLTASLEQNCIAPADEVVLHAFDLYRDDLYGPSMERRRQMADLFAEIAADVASLQALVPDLIERAMVCHPFEFPQIEQKEVR